MDTTPCNICGFVREHAMDKHHIDSNHKNNDPSNIMVLCTACHRELHIKKRGTAEHQKERRDLIKSIKEQFPDHKFLTKIKIMSYS